MSSFKEWSKDHITDNTPLGDLCLEVHADDSFPDDGNLPELLEYFESQGASGSVLDAAEAAIKVWAASRPTHGVLTWMAESGNPVYETFAADFARVLPPEGDRQTLRNIILNTPQEPDPTKFDGVDVFDVAWSEYQPACETPGCPAKVLLGRTQCAVHKALEELL